MDFQRAATVLFAASDKYDPIALGVLIVLPLVLSFVLYRYAMSRVHKGAPRWQLWASLVPILAGIVLAIQPLLAVSKPSYRDFYFLSSRSISLHYATFIVPCVAVLVLIGVILYSNHRDKMER